MKPENEFADYKFEENEEMPLIKIPKKSGDYLIHLHDVENLHFDLRLGWKGVLKSWIIPQGPSYDTRVKRLATRTEDHSEDYKSVEGYIPKIGQSIIWDAGTFVPLDDFERGFKKGHLRFQLNGIKIQGAWSLIQLKDDKNQKNWVLVKEDDEYAEYPTPTYENAPESVATGRTLEDLKSEKRNYFKKVLKKLLFLN